MCSVTHAQAKKTVVQALKFRAFDPYVAGKIPSSDNTRAILYVWYISIRFGSC